MEESVKLVCVSAPTLVEVNNADELIAFCARVSNPSNQSNTLSAPKLIKYLINNAHWSPFEMVSVTMEINTTRDIARQILRHRSFSFQEFSQRYANPDKDLGWELREARRQDLKNRQNSIPLDENNEGDNNLMDDWDGLQDEVRLVTSRAYRWAIEAGIAKEVARAVLPEGLIKSRLYMAGTLRSWIHYIDLREKNGTQKEHMEIALKCKEIIKQQFPSLNDYFNKE